MNVKTATALTGFSHDSLAILSVAMVIALAAPPASGGFVVHAQDTVLRWKFATADAFDVKLVQTTRAESTVGEKKLSLLMQTAMWMNWKVDEVDGNGRAEMTQSFTRLATKAAAPNGQKTIFDSAAEADDDNAQQMLRTIRPLLNSRFRVTMAPWGEIERVERSAETDSLLGDLPSLSQIKKLLTTDGLNQTLRQSLGILPGNAVSPGDTWRTKHSIDSPVGRFEVANRFTYDGTARYAGAMLHEIDMIGDIRVIEKDDDKSLGATAAAQQQTGVFYFDAERGHLVHSRLTQTIDSQADLIGNRLLQVRTSSESNLYITRRTPK